MRTKDASISGSRCLYFRRQVPLFQAPGASISGARQKVPLFQAPGASISGARQKVPLFQAPGIDNAIEVKRLKPWHSIDIDSILTSYFNLWRLVLLKICFCYWVFCLQFWIQTRLTLWTGIAIASFEVVFTIMTCFVVLVEFLISSNHAAIFQAVLPVVLASLFACTSWILLWFFYRVISAWLWNLLEGLCFYLGFAFSDYDSFELSSTCSISVKRTLSSFDCLH